MGKRKPGIFSSWSMQEILPMLGPAGLTSPAVLGELSRRLPSDCDVQNNFSGKDGTRWKFKNVFVSFRSVGRVSQPARIHRVAEHFKDFSISGNQCDRVPLVGIHPYIALPIQGDAVASLENGMSDEDIAQTERVGV